MPDSKGTDILTKLVREGRNVNSEMANVVYKLALDTSETKVCNLFVC